MIDEPRCLLCATEAEPGDEQCRKCGTRLLQIVRMDGQDPPQADGMRRRVASPVAAARPEPQEAIVLPPTRAAQRFIAAASDLEAELAHELDLTEAQLKDLTQRQRQRKRGRSLLGQILGMVSVEVMSQDTASRPEGASVERWSRRYGACRTCGRTDHIHKGRGYCSACYFKAPLDD